MGAVLALSPPCCCEATECPDTLFEDGVVPTGLQFEMSGTSRGAPTGTPSSQGFTHLQVWRSASVCTLNALASVVGPSTLNPPSPCWISAGYALEVVNGEDLWQARIYDEVDFFGNVTHHDEWHYLGQEGAARQAAVRILLDVDGHVKLRTDNVALGNSFYANVEVDLGEAPIDPAGPWSVSLSTTEPHPSCLGVSTLTITPQLPS